MDLKKIFRSFRKEIDDLDDDFSMEETLRKILPMLKSEEEIIAVLKKSNYDHKLCCDSIPFLKMNGKNTNEVMEVIRATEYNNSALWAFFRFLKVEEKTEEQRYELIVKSRFNIEFCRWMLPSLSSSEKIMYVLNICKYDIHLCILAVKLLPRDRKDDALKILENTGYHQSVCLAVLENFK
jgi:hypothetical protein